MEPLDLPQPAGHDYAHVIRTKVANKKMDDPLQVHIKPQASAQFSRGQIKAIELPKGWVKGKEKERTESSQTSYEVFHPPDRPDVMLWFFYRGTKIVAEAQAQFGLLLEKPAHLLSPGELANVSEIIRDKSDGNHFRILAARTESIGGKMVLTVEGRYLDSGEDAYSIYIDAGNKVIEEVHFRSPKADYLRYLKDAKAAVQSIKWE